MLSTLFTNLREHIITTKGVDFTEDFAPFDYICELRNEENQLFLSNFQKLLDFGDTADFAKVSTPKIGTKVQQKNRAITCTPGKTYPCGGVCRGHDKPCKNPIEGQAKNYLDWLNSQKNKPKEQINPPPNQDKEQVTAKEPTSKKTKPKRDSLFDLQNIPNEDAAKLLFKRLGSGAFGSVYLDDITIPPRAIKYGDIGDNEVRISRKLAKLGVSPEVFSPDKLLMEDDFTEAFAMEFIPGKTLNQANGNNPTTTKDFEQILKLRQKMHKASIYNFDMHAGNIMVRDDGVLKLIDHGMAGEDARLAYADAIGEINIRVESSPLYDRYKQAVKKAQIARASFKDNMTTKDYKRLTQDFYKEVFND